MAGVAVIVAKAHLLINVQVNVTFVGFDPAKVALNTIE